MRTRWTVKRNYGAKMRLCKVDWHRNSQRNISKAIQHSVFKTETRLLTKLTVATMRGGTYCQQRKYKQRTKQQRKLKQEKRDSAKKRKEESTGKEMKRVKSEVVTG